MSASAHTASPVDRLVRLQHLAVALGDALTPDDVARAALRCGLDITGVVRAALAVTRGAGRELEFVSSDDDALGPTYVRWCRIDGVADVPVAQAVRTGKPVLVGSLDDLAARYPHLLDRQRSLGTRAMAALPLAAGGQHLGALLLSFGAERPFDPDDRVFLEAFAAQVTQALRRALTYQAEVGVSERLQRSLLPQSLPELPGLSLGAYYQSGGHEADVGGDWYDVLPLPDRSVAVALGDVMGRGLPAAIVMGEVRAAVRAYALLDPDPVQVLQRLDTLIAELGVPEQLVTLAYGLLAADRRRIRLALAGHPPPLLVPPSGRPEPAPVEVGPPLGVRSGGWPVAEVSLPPRGALLLYSDGLVESRRVDFDTGTARLVDQVAAMDEAQRNPREMSVVLGESLPAGDDDVTILAVGEAAGEFTAAETFPADPSAAPSARRFVRRTLVGWEVEPDLLDTVQLCVSELVTNAVIHSQTPPRVVLRRDDRRLLLLVHDRGRHGTARVVDADDPLDITGRGLTLVEELTEAWGVEHNADGTTVWCEW